MFKKCALATAVGMICGGAAVSASAQGLNLNGPDNQGLNYAHELLFAADPEGPIQIFDDAGGDSDFIVRGLLDAGTSADDSLFIRFDMTNAEFRSTRFIGELEINNPDGSPALSSGGLANFGSPGDNKVIFSVQGQENIFPPDANPAQGALDVNDTVVFDLADGGLGPSSGLTWIDREQPVTVKMCVYETLDDARAETNDVMSNGCVEKTLIDPSEDALVFMCEKPGANPVANVWSDDGNYQNFVQQFAGTGRVNFGTCHIESRDDYLNVEGERATVGELLGPDYDLQVADGDLSTWAADSVENPFVGLVEDDDCTDDAADFLVLDWLNGDRTSNTLVRRMSDGLWDLDETKVTFNVCLNDLPGNAGPDWAIPIVEQHMVTLVSDNEKDAVYAEHVGGINRNGIVLRFPFVTTFEGADHRAYLTNRSNTDADYNFTCTPDPTSTVEYTSLRQGVIPAGTTHRVDIPAAVTFEGGRPTGACVVTIAGRYSEIDGAALLVTDTGINSENATPDELDQYVDDVEPTILFAPVD